MHIETIITQTEAALEAARNLVSQLEAQLASLKPTIVSETVLAITEELSVVTQPQPESVLEVETQSEPETISVAVEAPVKKLRKNSKEAKFFALLDEIVEDGTRKLEVYPDRTPATADDYRIRVRYRSADIYTTDKTLLRGWCNFYSDVSKWLASKLNEGEYTLAEVKNILLAA